MTKFALRFGLVNALMAIALTPAFARDDSAELTKKGIEFAKKKQYDQAAEEFGLAIKADPKDSRHYLNRANAYRAGGKLDEATKDFTTYSEMEPKRADGLVGLGIVKIAQKNPDGAIDELNKAIAIDEDNVEALRYRAFAYLSKNDFEKAIDDYTKVLAQKANDPQALERRGFAYRSSKQYDKAIEDFTALIQAKPKDPEGYRRRGFAYGQADNDAKALEDYRKVLELKPGDADATTRIKAVEGRKPAPATGAIASPPPAKTAPRGPSLAPSPR